MAARTFQGIWDSAVRQHAARPFLVFRSEDGSVTMEPTVSISTRLLTGKARPSPPNDRAWCSSVSKLSGHSGRRACMLATPAAGADVSAELR